MPFPPPTPGKFDQDPRAHVDKTTGKWQYEDEETGQTYEWTGKAWIPLVPAAPVLERETKIKKRKAGEKDNGGNNRPAKSQATAPKKTAVWVSNLPPNTTVEQLQSTFCKAGVLHVDDSGKPRIKLYYDDSGNFKGEALVMYFKEGSVDLAITLLDDTELELGAGYGNMRVRVAEYERTKSSAPEESSEGVPKAGEPSQKKQPLSAEAKRSLTKRMRNLENKLAWHSDDDDDGVARRGTAESQLARVVVLKYMFRLKELEEEPELLLELKEDVREEAETLGAVTSVVLYDKEEDGVMTVKFKEPVSAQACVAKMNGRYFGGRRILAAIYSGKERFRKSGGLSYDDEEQEQDRLDKFADWIAESED